MADWFWFLHLCLAVIVLFWMIGCWVCISEIKKRTLVIVTLIAVIVIGMFWYGGHRCATSDWIDTKYSTERIVALNDNNLVSGRMGRVYARRGYINEDLYYQYMVKLYKGGYVANKVNAKNTTLYCTDDHFRVEWWERTRGWLYFKETEKYNKIYLPEGSITDEYSIDLQ